MEIKNENGKIKTLDELFKEAKELMVDALDNLDTDDQLCIGNELRDRHGYARLYENKESCLNDILDGIDPAELLRMGQDWNDYADFFVYDYDLETTDDVWYDLDEEEIAEDILNEDFTPDYFPYELKEVLDNYLEAREQIENYNPYRAMCEEVVAKFVNCEADVTDLLQALDKLAKSDEAWGED